MKIYIPHDSAKFQGGGSTFIKNFSKSINKYGHEIVGADSNYDCLFIAGATLTDRNTVVEAKKNGKTIVLRVDNILEDRKNRNTGMSRLREYADLADVIVYQSEWAKRLLSPLLGNGVVIKNGVDTEVFFPRTEPKNWEGLRILYSKYSRNEVKQFHEVQYWWREYNLEKKDDTIVLVGQFAEDYRLIDHPFDFHNDEQYDYKGIIGQDVQLAEIMRTCDCAYLPYMFDACSNTVLEAQACGLPVIFSPTGGTPEIVTDGFEIDWHYTPSEMVQFAIGNKKKIQEIDREATFGLDAMAERYHALLTTITSNTYEV